MAVLYDFLPTVTPNYAQEFPIDSYSGALVIGGEKNVEIHTGYGVSEERILFSGQTKFYINLSFSLISESEEELLTDFYHDEDKACGTYRSFEFTPISEYSTEQHTYIVRFNGSLETFMQNVKKYGAGTIQLIVLGRKLD